MRMVGAENLRDCWGSDIGVDSKSISSGIIYGSILEFLRCDFYV